MLGSCSSTKGVLRQTSKDEAILGLEYDLLGKWRADSDLKDSPLNAFEFDYNERGAFEMRINQRLVQLTNLSVVGPLDFAISFKGLDFSEMFLLGKFQSYEKKVLLLINSDKENQTYEMMQNIRLVKQ